MPVEDGAITSISFGTVWGQGNVILARAVGSLVPPAGVMGRAGVPLGPNGVMGPRAPPGGRDRGIGQSSDGRARAACPDGSGRCESGWGRDLSGGWTTRATSGVAVPGCSAGIHGRPGRCPASASKSNRFACWLQRIGSPGPQARTTLGAVRAGAFTTRQGAVPLAQTRSLLQQTRSGSRRQLNSLPGRRQAWKMTGDLHGLP